VNVVTYVENDPSVTHKRKKD